MESIAPVGTAKVGAVDAVDLVVSLLSERTSAGENEVVIDKSSQDVLLVHAFGTIECDAEIDRGADGLEHIHIVGHGDAPQLFPGNVVVPAGPGRFFPGKKSGIGV